MRTINMELTNAPTLIPQISTQLFNHQTSLLALGARWAWSFQCNSQSTHYNDTIFKVVIYLLQHSSTIRLENNYSFCANLFGNIFLLVHFKTIDTFLFWKQLTLNFSFILNEKLLQSYKCYNIFKNDRFKSLVSYLNFVLSLSNHTKQIGTEGV